MFAEKKTSVFVGEFYHVGPNQLELDVRFCAQGIPRKYGKYCDKLICACFFDTKICNRHILGLALSNVCASRIRIKNINHHKPNCKTVVIYLIVGFIYCWI